MKGAGGESKGSRRYDKENLLWQFTVAIRSDRVGSRSEDCLFRLFNDWRRSLTLADNKWVAETEPICRFHGRPTKDLIYKYPDRLDQIHDDNQSEVESQTATPLS